MNNKDKDLILKHLANTKTILRANMRENFHNLRDARTERSLALQDSNLGLALAKEQLCKELEDFNQTMIDVNDLLEELILKVAETL